MVYSLSSSELTSLKESLYYMHVEELKEICEKLNLSPKGQKGALIERIYLFLKDGVILKALIIPAISKAKKGVIYPLDKKTLILKGAYKNDLKTRLFMKTLVGEHFHFTAFGQDFIKARWMEGSPPTYLEFALFWQKEYSARKKRKATPKQEWAYLNFLQQHKDTHPQETLTSKWEKKRTQECAKALKILKKVMRV